MFNLFEKVVGIEIDNVYIIHTKTLRYLGYSSMEHTTYSWYDLDPTKYIENIFQDRV